MPHYTITIHTPDNRIFSMHDGVSYFETRVDKNGHAVLYVETHEVLSVFKRSVIRDFGGKISEYHDMDHFTMPVKKFEARVRAPQEVTTKKP